MISLTRSSSVTRRTPKASFVDLDRPSPDVRTPMKQNTQNETSPTSDARGLVKSYLSVCEELTLDEEERDLLWLAIAKEIERVEEHLGDAAASATEEQILAAARDLGAPTFRMLGERIRMNRIREK